MRTGSLPTLWPQFNGANPCPHGRPPEGFPHMAPARPPAGASCTLPGHYAMLGCGQTRRDCYPDESATAEPRRRSLSVTPIAATVTQAMATRAVGGGAWPSTKAPTTAAATGSSVTMIP